MTWDLKMVTVHCKLLDYKRGIHPCFVIDPEIIGNAVENWSYPGPFRVFILMFPVLTVFRRLESCDNSPFWPILYPSSLQQSNASSGILKMNESKESIVTTGAYHISTRRRIRRAFHPKTRRPHALSNRVVSCPTSTIIHHGFRRGIEHE